MRNDDFISVMSEGGASEREIEIALMMSAQIQSPEEQLAFEEDMKKKFVSSANKGFVPSVKATSSAAKAAKEAGVKIEEVSSESTIVTRKDVEKSVETK
jgi:hypothetical protein